MINFINGENGSGMLTGIFYLEDLENENFNPYDAILSEECWILYLANGDCNAEVFNVRERGICIIPRDNEFNDENYDIFWSSYRTCIFADIHELHDFLLDYRGQKYDEIVSVYDYVRECLEKEEIASRYMCTCNISENLDIELMNELDNLIIEKGVRPDTVFATLKTMLLSQYSIQFDEVVPKLENTQTQ